MRKTLPLAAIAAALILTGLASPARAADQVAGEEAFKTCKACHSIVAPDGAVIQKGGKTGPNLYGVVGRPVGADPAYSYGPGLLAVAALGMTWDEAAIAAYAADPGGWVKQATGDDGLRSKMSFSLSSGGEDVAAYLASVGG